MRRNDSTAANERQSASPEALLCLFPAGWTAAHLQLGAEYDVAFRVHWKQSGRYKNVTKVEQL